MLQVIVSSLATVSLIAIVFFIPQRFDTVGTGGSKRGQEGSCPPNRGRWCCKRSTAVSVCRFLAPRVRAVGACPYLLPFNCIL